MALRVLLADESISIKKVIQLSLQDYGVEVKSVPVGIDVLEVAKIFQPDIVFADILLSKRSGYEVAKDLKGNPSTAKVPIVLMWSGFMELDSKKADEAQIDGQLEKPFDADQLRTLVKNLVPRLSSNAISNYLQFSQRPEFLETENAAPQAEVHTAVSVEEPAMMEFSSPSGGSAYEPIEGIEEFQKEESLPFLAEMDEHEDFQQVPLPRARGKDLFAKSNRSGEIDPNHNQESNAEGSEESDENWMESKLSDFVVDMPEDSDAYEPTEQDLTSTSIAISGGETEIMLLDLDKPHWGEPGSESTQIKSLAQATGMNSGSTSSGLSAGPSGLSSAISNAVSSAAAAAVAAGHTAITNSQTNIRSGSALIPAGSGRLSEDRLEAIAREELRAQTQQVLEDIAWKLIPDIAERIIREEIEKLLQERQNLPQ